MRVGPNAGPHPFLNLSCMNYVPAISSHVAVVSVVRMLETESESQILGTKGMTKPELRPYMPKPGSSVCFKLITVRSVF